MMAMGGRVDRGLDVLTPCNALQAKPGRSGATGPDWDTASVKRPQASTPGDTSTRESGPWVQCGGVLEALRFAQGGETRMPRLFVRTLVAMICRMRLVRFVPTWPKSWPPGPDCPRGSRPASWRWLSLVGKLEAEVTRRFRAEIQSSESCDSTAGRSPGLCVSSFKDSSSLIGERTVRANADLTSLSAESPQASSPNPWH